MVTAIISTTLAIAYGSFVAGGADQYGYISEARLWMKGNLTVHEPLANILGSMPWSVAPLGYRPAIAPGAIVPIYSPGLPLAMAAVAAVAGESAMSLVVPLLGGLAVWLTFVIGNRAGGQRVGAMAALFTACSPILLFQSLQPMSDVPVTAWWLLAIAFATWEQRPRLGALLAGLSASAAVATRPNLVVLALAVGWMLLLRQPRLTRTALFGMGLLPGCLLIAVVNTRLYGSPLTSGYGRPETIYSWHYLSANLLRYPGWMIQIESLAIALALIAPLTVERDRRFDRRLLYLMLFFTGLLCLSYIFYLPFDHWSFLRFLLPCIPLLIILMCTTIANTLGRLPNTIRAAVAFLVVGSLFTWYVQTNARLGVLKVFETEKRYLATGSYIANSTPPNAVVFAMQESGSVRIYGDRPTVRWDVLSASEFDRAMSLLEDSGYEPYLVLEEWEIPEFKRRLAGSAVSSLHWPPAAEFIGPISVRIYRLNDRFRKPEGEWTLTQPVPGS